MVRLDGNNITVPGQVAITGSPTSALHSIRRGDAGKFRAFVTGLDLNGAAPLDLDSIDLSLSGKYLPTEIIAYDATANLATAQLGLYTAAGAGGTEIVAPAALTGLTGSGKFHSLTIAALTDLLVAGTLYPRLTVAAGTAGTCSLLIAFTIFD